MILLQLFWNFLVIGAVSFGGGYGMISLVRETVLGHGCYSNYETGKRDIPTEVLIQLAGLYHTSTDYILGLTDDSAPPIPRKA